MKHLFRLTSFVFLAIIMATSCSDDDIDLGEFNLMEGSKSAVPYQEDLLITFKDSLGNQAVFEFDTSQSGFSNMGHLDMSAPNGEDYSAKVETYEVYLGEPEPILGIEFRVNVRVSVDFLNDVEITDMLIVDMDYYKEGYHLAHFIEQVVNPRGASAAYIEQFPDAINEITLLDKTFQDVYVSQHSTIYYNHEFGVIAFRDSNNKLWVYDNVELKN